MSRRGQKHFDNVVALITRFLRRNLAILGHNAVRK